jgi:fatty acid synthase
VQLSILLVSDVPVHIYKEMNIVQSGGVEVRGLRASVITRRKPLSKPVLEKYMLTPNVEPAHLDLHTTLRVCTHIALENKPVTQVKVVEVHNQGWTPLSPAVAVILADLPLLKASGLLS